MSEKQGAEDFAKKWEIVRREENKIGRRALTHQEMFKTFMSVELKYFLWCLKQAITIPFKAARDTYRERTGG